MTIFNLNKLSIGKKLFILLLLSILAPTSIVMFYSLGLIRSEVTQQLEIRARALSLTFATYAEDAILNRDISWIQSKMDEFRRMPGVGYIYFVDSEGRTLAHTFSPIVPEEILLHREDPNLGPHIDRTQIGGKTYIDGSAPIIRGLLGWVHYSLDEEWALRRHAELIRSVLVTVILAVGMIWIVLAILGQRALRPLRELASLSGKEASSLSSRDLDRFQEFESKDEIGQLSASYAQLLRQVLDHKKNLEEEVARRTRELEETHVKLFNSSKLSAIGEMAAGIAHEINTPLMAISLLSENIESSLDRNGEVDRNQIQSSLTRINSTISRITKLVQSLKKLSRMSKNDVHSQINLATVYHETMELCRERLKLRSIQLHEEIESVLVRGQPIELGQVILNLLNNSIDAIEQLPERWIRVQIKKEETLAILRVTDSGLGIPPEVVGKIMNPFFTTKPVGKGTGLGLSISRQIIEAHGGTLYLDTASRYTSFVIELKIAV